LIAFVGSVFSPYYRRAWRAGTAVAEEHCAINVALYSPGAQRWAMTERGRAQVRRSAHVFEVGPSALRWSGAQGLAIELDEVANPLPRKVSGTIHVRPEALSRYATALDRRGRHRWGPIAPCARIEVNLRAPALRWSGHAYLDSNEGDEPISEPFERWDWLRAPLADGSTVVAYDVREHGGSERLIGQRFMRDGSTCPIALPPRAALPASRWRVQRHLRHDDAGGAPALVRSLEDTPFYSRSLVAAHLAGQPVQAVHESFDARRFAAPWVQALLPFRMPRRAGS
jgi:carotenoid 1,2-hydratase